MKSKEGRHVGLDFYDLLIEALIDLAGVWQNVFQTAECSSSPLAARA
jgi:hypothetical protein